MPYGETKSSEFNKWRADLTSVFTDSCLTSAQIKFITGKIESDENGVAIGSSVVGALWDAASTVTEIKLLAISLKFKWADEASVESFKALCDSVYKRTRAVHDVLKEKAIPDVPLTEAAEPISDNDDDFIKVFNKAPKGKKQSTAKKVKIIIPDTPIDQMLRKGGMKPALSFTEKLEANTMLTASAIWPTAVHHLGWFRTAAVNAPFVDGRRIRRDAVNQHRPDAIQWRPVTPPTYYDCRKCSPELLVATAEAGLLPPIIVEKTIKDFGDKLPKVGEETDEGMSEETAIRTLSSKAFVTAEVTFYWGNICKLLKDNDAEGKIPFVNLWMSRLLDTPDVLQNGLPDVASAFFRFIRHCFKADGKINRVLYGFLCANLATWKSGEAREDFIARCQPSLQAYWGPLAKTYVECFKDTPDGKMTIKPKPDNTLQRLRKVAAKAATKATQAAEAVMANPDKVPEKDVDELVTSIEEKDRADKAVSRWFNFKTLKTKAWNLVQSFVDPSYEEEVPVQEYTNAKGQRVTVTFSGHNARSIFWGVMRKTIGSPFFHVVKTNEKMVDGTLIKSTKCARRKWFNDVIDWTNEAIFDRERVNKDCTTDYFWNGEVEYTDLLQKTDDENNDGVRRPRFLSNMFNNIKPAPASLPLPIRAVLNATVGGAHLIAKGVDNTITMIGGVFWHEGARDVSPVNWKEVGKDAGWYAGLVAYLAGIITLSPIAPAASVGAAIAGETTLRWLNPYRRYKEWKQGEKDAAERKAQEMNDELKASLAETIANAPMAELPRPPTPQQATASTSHSHPRVDDDEDQEEITLHPATD